jgi:hypothetical protein
MKKTNGNGCEAGVDDIPRDNSMPISCLTATRKGLDLPSVSCTDPLNPADKTANNNLNPCLLPVDAENVLRSKASEEKLE